MLTTGVCQPEKKKQLFSSKVFCIAHRRGPCELGKLLKMDRFLCAGPHQLLSAGASDLVGLARLLEMPKHLILNQYGVVCDATQQRQADLSWIALG
jgi:hypothetical protein